jgi:hypothetical protein
LTRKVANSDILSPDKYKIYREDRNIKRGGGVLVAVSKKITSKRRKDLESPTKAFNEMLIVEVRQKNGRKLAILSAYKPPDQQNYTFADNIRHCLQSLWNKGFIDVITMGDFNFPDIDWEIGYPTSIVGLDFQVAEIFQDYGLQQMNTFPSREGSNNILDLILTNNPEKLSNLQAYDDCITTDHTILEFKYEFETKLHLSKPKTVLNYRRADFQRINTILRDSNLMAKANIEDIDEAVDAWTETVWNIIKSNVPSVKIRSANSAPWVDADVIHLSNQKHTKWKQARRSGTQQAWATYKEYNYRFTRLVNNKYNEYIRECTENINERPKMFWSLVNSMGKDRSYPEAMIYNGRTLKNDQEIADGFNEFFTSVFTQPEANPEIPDVIPTVNPNLANIRIDEEETMKLLKSIDPTKAMGADNLSGKVIIECAESLCESVTRIINRSLEEGHVPKSWKHAQVCPVFKKGEKTEVTNYRPISLLTILSKIMERCVYSHIIGHIKPLLDPRQHGFLSGRSTITQLLEVYEDISKLVDRRGQVDVIFLDLSKAFDSVPHTYLLRKITQFGLNGKLLEWFHSYLHDRTQEVVINDSHSAISTVLSGVPQGSILGPLLFLMYIDGIPETIRGDCQSALYADDSKIYREINHLQDCLELQAQLDNLVSWSESWKLKFNPNKCTRMSITRKLWRQNFGYNINGEILEKVQEMRDLGLVVQDNLLWDKQIGQMVSTASRNLYFIKRVLGYMAPPKAKITLYKALVRSQLEYGTVIWTAFSKNNLELLESIQRRATIYISRTKEMDYRERMAEANLVPLSYRREQLDLFFAHKARAGIFGLKLQTLCSVNQARRRLRGNIDRTLIHQGFSHTETYRHFFTHRLPPIWNSLPAETRNIEYIENSSVFKNAVKFLL